jgi:hypothetical protein
LLRWIQLGHRFLPSLLPLYELYAAMAMADGVDPDRSMPDATVAEISI